MFSCTTIVQYCLLFIFLAIFVPERRIGFLKVHEVNLATLKDSETDVSSFSPSSE